MIAAIVGPFTQAVRATIQPCTFLLIVPTLAAVVVAGAHWQALIGATIAAVLGGWVLADNEILFDGGWLRVSGLVVAVVLCCWRAEPRGTQSREPAGISNACGCRPAWSPG